MISFSVSRAAFALLLSVILFPAQSAWAADVPATTSSSGAYGSDFAPDNVGHYAAAVMSVQERDMARRMTDMTPSAQSDYGYISEREIVTLSGTMRPDAELIRRTEAERRNNMVRARHMSLLDLNQMMSPTAPELPHVPDRGAGFMGASVYMHMMHLDYAQAMHEQWRQNENLLLVRQSAASMGEVREDDVSFYRKHGYDKECRHYRFSICMTRFSPTISSIFTINHYAHELKEALSINHDDVYSNYSSLWQLNEHLQDIIRRDLQDSNTVGVREYRQLQERISRTGQVSFDRNLNAATHPVQDQGRIIRTQEEVRAATASAATEAVRENKGSSSGVDVMISLDDLPNGYDQDYEKYNKKFRTEFLKGNTSTGSAPPTEPAQQAGRESGDAGAESVDVMITLDDLPYGYDKSYERHNKRFSAAMMFSGSDDKDSRPVRIAPRDEVEQSSKTAQPANAAEDSRGSTVQSADGAGAASDDADRLNSQERLHGAASPSRAEHEQITASEQIMASDQTRTQASSPATVRHSNEYDARSGATVPAIIPVPVITVTRAASSICQLSRDEILSAYGGHGGLQIVHPALPARAARRQYIREILSRHSDVNHEVLIRSIKSDQRPTFEDDQGTYLDYSLLYHISRERLQGRGLLIRGAQTDVHIKQDRATEKP